MPDPTLEMIQNELKNQVDARAKAVAKEIIALLNSGAGLKAVREFIKKERGMRASGLQSMQPPMQAALQPDLAQKQQQDKQLQEKKRQEAIFSPLNPGFLRAVAMYLQKILLAQDQFMQEEANQEPRKKRPIGDPEEEAAEALENEKSNEYRDPDPKSEFLLTLEKLAEEKALQEKALAEEAMLDPLKQKFGNTLGQNTAFQQNPSQVLQETVNGTIAKEIEGSVSKEFPGQEKIITNAAKNLSEEGNKDQSSAPRAHKASTPFDNLKKGPSPYDERH